MRANRLGVFHGVALLALLSLGACSAVSPPPAPTETDRSLIHSTTQQALENVPTGESLTWENSNNDHRGTVMPLETHEERADGPCRSYQQTFTAENITQAAYGVACRGDDGNWETIRSTQFSPVDGSGRYSDSYNHHPHYDPYFYDPYYPPFGHHGPLHGGFSIYHGHRF